MDQRTLGGRTQTPKQGVDHLFSSIIQEQERLTKQIDEGQNKTQDLRSGLDRIFQKFEDLRKSELQGKIDIYNNIQCPKCKHSTGVPDLDSNGLDQAL